LTLPESFLAQMRDMLPLDEFDEFCITYGQPTVRGLRWNMLKVGVPDNFIFAGSPVSWCATGQTYSETKRPAKSILYHAGLFYIQEPSAMCPVEVLFADDPTTPQNVLDLCAAPGGKSVQIAGHMQGRGLLVSNDASPTRSRALVKNLERAGVTNAVVTTEMPKKLTARFPEFFDRILVDAPCSGEGMFRRDPDAVKAYTANKPEACMEMQRDILHNAAALLRPGGRLVYSTCTFNMDENERMISWFLQNFPEFVVEQIDHAKFGISPGLGILPQAGRIFPHRACGEGHFVALLVKKGVYAHNNVRCDVTVPPSEFAAFINAHLKTELPSGTIIPHGSNIYLQPFSLDLRGIRVARSGWFLGEVAKGRFVPSHALAMGLRKQDATHSVELSEENALRYLRGETLDHVLQIHDEKSKPYVMMCYNSFPLGWARFVQGRLKNCLPVGLALSN